MQHRALLQRARDRAGERHLEPIEDPGDPEGGNHQGVETAPRQPIEPRRDVGFDDRVLGARSQHANPQRRSKGFVRTSALAGLRRVLAN
jgi:hypothetical protein